MYGKIPLKNLLKGELLRIAELQDKAVIDIISHFNVVFHGGTALWRIYGGKRFSYDIDMYYSNPREIHGYLASQKSFSVVLNRITGSNVVYSKISEGRTVIELEISPMFRAVNAVSKEFVLTDGSTMVVATISPEDMLSEKVSAYMNRMKARDLYDIYYLAGLAKGTEELRKDLRRLLESMKTMPKDFGGLREIVLVGNVPAFEMIVSAVRRYAKG
jgi:predicted nucleotidyltransferase component of viral defense system